MRDVVALLSTWGPPGAFLLAAIDSAGIPLPTGVDALIVLVAVTNSPLAWLTAALATAGSALGCMILFGLARKGGELYLERHAASPRAMRFRNWFARYGLVTVFVPALVPIPLPTKVFVLSAGALGVRPLSFLVVITAARLARYFGLAWLGLRLGNNALSWLTSHAWQIALIAALLGGAVVLLLSRNRKRTAPVLP